MNENKTLLIKRFTFKKISKLSLNYFFVTVVYTLYIVYTLYVHFMWYITGVKLKSAQTLR